MFEERGTKASLQLALCETGQERGPRCSKAGCDVQGGGPPPILPQHPLPRQAKAVWKLAKLIQQTMACRDGRRIWAL